MPAISQGLSVATPLVRRGDQSRSRRDRSGDWLASFRDADGLGTLVRWHRRFAPQPPANGGEPSGFVQIVLRQTGSHDATPDPVHISKLDPVGNRMETKHLTILIKQTSTQIWFEPSNRTRTRRSSAGRPPSDPAPDPSPTINLSCSLPDPPTGGQDLPCRCRPPCYDQPSCAGFA